MIWWDDKDMTCFKAEYHPWVTEEHYQKNLFTKARAGVDIQSGDFPNGTNFTTPRANLLRAPVKHTHPLQTALRTLHTLLALDLDSRGTI